MPTSSSSTATTEAVVQGFDKQLPSTAGGDKQEEVKAAAANSLINQVRGFVSGGVGGVCAVVVGHPFDLVKVRLQTAEAGVYSSAVDVVRKSIARDGLRQGLYAGVSAPLVGVTPMCMFFFPPFLVNF